MTSGGRSLADGCFLRALERRKEKYPCVLVLIQIKLCFLHSVWLFGKNKSKLCLVLFISVVFYEQVLEEKKFYFIQALNLLHAA